MSKTIYMVLAQYEKAVIPLDEICEEYFGMDKKTAYQAAAANELPMPVIRMRDSRKCPWMVSAEELAALIDSRRDEAKREWLRANAA